MDREQYEAAKARLGEVTRRLRQEQMSLEERERLEEEGSQLARAVMSPWFPFGLVHRFAMAFITAVGLWGLMEGRTTLLLIWFALPFFSPRVVGEILNAVTGFKKDSTK
jgi:hypothetical protein